MRGWLYLFAGLLALPSFPAGAEGGRIGKDCTFQGKKLWGKVEIVTSFPDIKVQIVSAFPDLKVKQVESFPDSCGEWQSVTAFPDLKVQFVTSFPDIKITYVTSFPGLP